MMFEEIYDSYLTNVATKGIHVWKFIVHGEDSCWMIGIWNTKSGKPVVEGAFIDNTNDDDICSGYIIRMDGRKTDPQDVASWRLQRFYPWIKDGDIIELRLDLIN